MSEEDIFRFAPKKYKEKAVKLQEKLEAATKAMNDCAKAVRENTKELKALQKELELQRTKAKGKKGRGAESEWKKGK